MLIFIFLVFTTINNCHADKKRKINVGTVLFSETDVSKECWTTDNIALLTSRMLLEDVLPKKDVLAIQDNGFVIDIIDYFRLILEVVRRMTSGKSKHVMLLALTDTLGGYLHRYVIPTAKQAYYAGFIDFDAMEKLLQLFNELKCFLRTDGHGWAKPVVVAGKSMQGQPLPTPAPAPATDACKGLIYIQNSADSPTRKCAVIIPMPFFDSKANPSAIAVPFKSYSLRNIESRSAAYILVKFYTAATKCLASHSKNQTGPSEFEGEYFTWIDSQVLPHLRDEKFYSAFGGVLRVYETMKKNGAQVNEKKIANFNIMPELQVTESAKDAFKEMSSTKQRKKSDLILMALLATIFVWFLLGSLFICYRIRAAKTYRDECGNPEMKPCPKHKSSSHSNKYSGKIAVASSRGTSSKKPSTTTQSSKNLTTSSGKVSPSISVDSVRSAAVSEAPKSSLGSGRSRKSEKSSVGNQCNAPCAYENKSKASGVSQCTICSQKRSLSTKSSASSSKIVAVNPCLCTTTFTENLRLSTSLDDISSRNNQLVFGYDMETSSSAQSCSPREPSEEIEDYGAGNLSK